MSEVKRYHVTEAGLVEGQALGRINVVLGPDFDSAVQCFLTAAEGCVAAERRERALQKRLTAADERADVLEAENRRLRDDDLFYDAACEAMEGHQKERAKLGKEIGCQGSLIDGIAWIYQRLAELEKSPSGYTKQHHPVEFGPSDSRRIGCSCGHPDPNHEAAKP